MSMAVVMSEMPDVWRKVLAEHVPDERHHCRACFHDGGRASWPCQTYRIAQEAKWVAEGGLPGTGPHGPGPSRTRMSPPEPSRRVDAGPALGDHRSEYQPEYRSDHRVERPSALDASPYALAGSGSYPATGSFGAGADFSLPSTSLGTGIDDRPFAGDPLAPSAPAMTGERSYGSTYDAPYGASFGVDDRPHATRW